MAAGVTDGRSLALLDEFENGAKEARKERQMWQYANKGPALGHDI